MHFLRCDVAGNISKRYSARGCASPRASGSCAKWAVHNAFLNPSVITRQYSMMPDGATYFCFAQGDDAAAARARWCAARPTRSASARTPTPRKHLAYAQDMPYTDAATMAVPVGVSCRFCERTDCNQRAAPSYKFAFNVDEYTKKDNFFSPLVGTDRSE